MICNSSEAKLGKWKQNLFFKKSLLPLVLSYLGMRWCSAGYDQRDESWHFWWMSAHSVLRSPLNLHDKRSQCQVRTHHRSAASDCDQVDRSFCFSLEGEGNRLSYDFSLSAIGQALYCTSALFAKFSYDGDINQGSLHRHPYSQGVCTSPKPGYWGSFFPGIWNWAELNKNGGEQIYSDGGNLNDSLFLSVLGFPMVPCFLSSQVLLARFGLHELLVTWGLANFLCKRAR